MQPGGSSPWGLERDTGDVILLHKGGSLALPSEEEGGEDGASSCGHNAVSQSSLSQYRQHPSSSSLVWLREAASQPLNEPTRCFSHARGQMPATGQQRGSFIISQE